MAKIPGVFKDEKWYNNWAIKDGICHMEVEDSDGFYFKEEDIQGILYNGSERLIWVREDEYISASSTSKKFFVGHHLSTSYRPIKKSKMWPNFNILRRKATNGRRRSCSLDSAENLRPKELFESSLATDSFWLFGSTELSEWIEMNIPVPYNLRIKQTLAGLSSFDLLQIATPQGLSKAGLESTACKYKILNALKTKHNLIYYRLLWLSLENCGMCELMDYNPREVIGKGAFGTVIRVVNKYTQREKAVKIIKAVDARSVMNVQREIINQQKAYGPWVVEIMQWGVAKENYLWIMMDYYPATLKERVKDASLEMLIRWINQLIMGVNEIHKRKVMHRDLKPANILVDENDNIKIGDMGLSVSLDTSLEERITKAGTPAYMSPEVLAREPYTTKSDVYSIGVIMYEMVHKKLPIPGKVYNPKEIIPGLTEAIRTSLNPDKNERPDIGQLLRTIKSLDT